MVNVIPILALCNTARQLLSADGGLSYAYVTNKGVEIVLDPPELVDEVLGQIDAALISESAHVVTYGDVRWRQAVLTIDGGRIVVRSLTLKVAQAVA